VAEPVDVLDREWAVQSECAAQRLELLVGGLRAEQDLGDVARDQVDQDEDEDRDSEQDRDDRHDPSNDVLSQGLRPRALESLTTYAAAPLPRTGWRFAQKGGSGLTVWH